MSHMIGTLILYEPSFFVVIGRIKRRNKEVLLNLFFMLNKLVAFLQLVACPTSDSRSEQTIFCMVRLFITRASWL